MVGTSPAVSADDSLGSILQYFILAVLIAGTVGIVIYYMLEFKKSKELKKSDEKFWKRLK